MSLAFRGACGPWSDIMLKDIALAVSETSAVSNIPNIKHSFDAEFKTVIDNHLRRAHRKPKRILVTGGRSFGALTGAASTPRAHLYNRAKNFLNDYTLASVSIDDSPPTILRPSATWGGVPKPFDFHESLSDDGPLARPVYRAGAPHLHDMWAATYTVQQSFIRFVLLSVIKARRSFKLNNGNIILAHGKADGADSMSAFTAFEYGQPVLSFPANWTTQGQKAGVVRNKRMFDFFEPDLVIAFPGGRGTTHMRNHAKKAVAANTSKADLLFYDEVPAWWSTVYETFIQAGRDDVDQKGGGCARRPDAFADGSASTWSTNGGLHPVTTAAMEKIHAMGADPEVVYGAIFYSPPQLRKELTGLI